METRRPEPIPSVLRILATDGHVAFLISMGLDHAWHWVTVFAPQVLLVVPALLWARSIQAVFRRGVAVSGTVTRQRVGLYGLLVIEFSYLAEGRECRNSNHFVPLAPSKLLKPGTAIEVLLSDSRFPGPLVRDAYWYGNGGAT
jgi:hypothetical protein